MAHIPRLTRLIHVLKNLPPDADFNLTDFAAFTTPDPSYTPSSYVSNACGTNACAVGYGALDPVLQAEGLQLVALFNNDIRREVCTSIEHFNSMLMHPNIHRFHLTYGGSGGSFGARQFFGISSEQFDDLFVSLGYDDEAAGSRRSHVTREQVIAKLEAFINV